MLESSMGSELKRAETWALLMNLRSLTHSLTSCRRCCFWSDFKLEMKQASVRERSLCCGGNWNVEIAWNVCYSTLIIHNTHKKEKNIQVMSTLFCIVALGSSSWTYNFQGQPSIINSTQLSYCHLRRVVCHARSETRSTRTVGMQITCIEAG